jgi:hypothetical protein
MKFRSFLVIFSAFTLIQGIWILSAELLRPGLGSERSAADRGPQTRAKIAATIGLVRGDLWAEDALIQSGFDTSSGNLVLTGATSETSAARAAADRALSSAPLQAQMWLLLAASASSSGTDNVGAAALDMAYLTAPQSAALIPSRLLIAARSSALADQSVQDFVRMDADYIFTKAPALKSAFVAAYSASLPENRPFLEQVAKASGQSILPTLH